MVLIVMSHFCAREDGVGSAQSSFIKFKMVIYIEQINLKAGFQIVVETLKTKIVVPAHIQMHQIWCVEMRGQNLQKQTIMPQIWKKTAKQRTRNSTLIGSI